MPKIKVNDINLYYEVHGEGQPLVFVAGFSANHSVWQSVAHEFAKKYKVILFDNRGCGQSDCPDYPYTMEMLAKDVVELCRVLNFGHVHMVGNSMGAKIVQTIAYKYPEILLKGVACNAGMKVDIKYALVAKHLVEFIEAKINVRSVIEALTLPWVYSSNFLQQPGMVDTIVNIIMNDPNPTSLLGLKNQLHTLTTFDSTSWVSKIKTPCLIIGSDEDLIVSAFQTVELAQEIPNAEYYCFKGAGHLPHIEQPKLFTEVVMQFLES
jgi:3-oxoadipate enol-lactonase